MELDGGHLHMSSNKSLSKLMALAETLLPKASQVKEEKEKETGQRECIHYKHGGWRVGLQGGHVRWCPTVASSKSCYTNCNSNSIVFWNIFTFSEVSQTTFTWILSDQIWLCSDLAFALATYETMSLGAFYCQVWTWSQSQALISSVWLTECIPVCGFEHPCRVSSALCDHVFTNPLVTGCCWNQAVQMDTQTRIMISVFAMKDGRAARIANMIALEWTVLFHNMDGNSQLMVQC